MKKMLLVKLMVIVSVIVSYVAIFHATASASAIIFYQPKAPKKLR